MLLQKCGKMNRRHDKTKVVKFVKVNLRVLDQGTASFVPVTVTARTNDVTCSMAATTFPA